MMLTPQEFDAILADAGKRIEGDIAWLPNPQHIGAVGFRAEVASAAGYPLFVAGWYRPHHFALAYTLVHRPFTPSTLDTPTLTNLPGSE